MKPRIYTYKITFPGTSYFYWGVHKERVFDEKYWGSPSTNKWAWDFYDAEKQVLECFPYSDEGWKQANLVEDRLIRPDLNNPCCLNEGCSGTGVSLKVARENGRRSTAKLMAEKKGMYSDDPVYLSERNKKNAAKRTKEGLARGGRAAIAKRIAEDPDYQRRCGLKGAAKGGARSKELGVGICGIPTEERRERGKQVAAKKWEDPLHPELGALSAGSLTLKQKSRGLPHGKENRVRVG